MKNIYNFLDRNTRRICSLLLFRTMLLPALFVTAFSVYGQSNLTLSFNNATLKEVLNEIEKQTGFYFMYNTGLIDVNQRVSVEKINATLEEVLSSILDKNKILFKVVDRQVLLSPADLVAPKPNESAAISGNVVDVNGEPLVGVSVLQKGTTRGVVTDAEGRFTISVLAGTSLKFSSVGYKDLEMTATQGMTVKMQEDAQNIDDVVVVGYGTQKKVTLTGSVSSVSGDQLLKRSAVSTSTLLQGTMPGITVQQTSGEPGADGASIRIRGTGSINAGQDPLVLVDGMEMPLDRLDPNTIESVTTLKDAASASIYGSRAANGVILITTKRGREGKVEVNYRGTVTTQMPTNMPERISIADNMIYSNLANRNAGLSTDVYSQEVIDYYSKYKGDNWNYPETDWFKEIVKPYAILTDHTVNMSGGGERLKFLATGNYTYQDGLVQTNDYKRYSLRINTDSKIFDWMRFSLDANLLQSERLTPIHSARSLISKSLYLLGELPGINADGTWGEGKNGDNPIAVSREGGENITKTPEILVNGQLFLTPIKGMEVVGQYSRRMVTTDVRNFTRGYDYYSQGTFRGHMYDKGLYQSNAKTVRNYYRTQASYTFDLKQHNIKVMAGFQAEDNFTESWESSKSGFTIPGREYFSNATGDATTNGGATEWSMASAYGRINYDYAEKYLLELSARWDASSRFARNLRWKMFPSASIGWVFTKEKFMESANEVMNFGKIRASWGELGNQNLNANYPSYALVETGWSYWFNNELNTGVAITEMNNPNITWEKSTQYNVGIDLAFFKNRLTFTGDFYIKEISDMIMKFPPPYYIGLNPAYTNAANMRNIGWEIALGYKGEIGKDFNYSVSLVLDDTRNKITDMKGLTYQDKSYVVGYPANGHWGYKTDGYFQTDEDVANSPYFDLKTPKKGYVKYVNQTEGDNLITQDDQVFLGDPFPHYNYGIKLWGEWKGLDLNIFIQGVGEQAKFMSGLGVVPFAQGASLYAHQLDTWTPENPNAQYPILLPWAQVGNNFDKSDKYVRSGAYVRLKNVELGYRIPQSITEKVKINYLRFYVSGQNLLTFSNYVKGFDPEASVTGTNGGEFYPIMRTFTFGLDIRF